MVLPWTWHGNKVSARRRRGLRPQLERLEDRLQPSIVQASGTDQKIDIGVPAPLVQTEPSVAMDANGDYVVVWNQQLSPQSSYLYNVDARVYNSAGVAQGSGPIVVAVTNGDTSPSVAMDPNGDFVVAYQVFYSTSNYLDGISAQRFNPAGQAQGSAIVLNSGATQATSGSIPKVAMDAAGDFAIVFQGYDANNHGIFAERFNSSGVSQGSIFRVNNSEADNQNSPAIAMDSAGNFVIAWQDGGPLNGGPGQDGGIYAQRFNSSGVAQGSNTAISTVDVSLGFSPDNPSVAMEPTGQYVIAWRGGNNLYDVEAQRFNAAGAALTGVVQVNTTENFKQGGTAVAIDSEGDFVVAWEIYEQPDTGTILAQRVNSAGTLIGTTQFTPSTQSGDNQRHPAIASNPNGNTIIVWESEPPTPSGNHDAYGRLYNYVNDAPTINTPGNVTINENAGQQTVNLAGITAGGGETQTLTVTASSNNTALINPSITYTSPNSTGTLSFTPVANSFGTATITVKVMDDGGTLNGGVDTTSVQFTVQVDSVNQAPAIISAGSTTFTVGALGTYAVVATGTPKPTFSLTGTVPTWLSIGSTSGILTGTPPNLGTGPYTFNFTVDASNGISPDFMQPFTLTVDQAPAITSAASTTFTVGSLGTYSVVATGNPKPTFSLTGTVPAWLSIGSTTGILTGTPPNLGTGPYTFNFTVDASNGVSPDFMQPFTLTVDQAPAITSAASTTFTVGSPGTYTVVATGNPAPTFSLTGTVPAWLSIGSTTGILTGTPPNLGTGPYTFAFTVDASNGVSPDFMQPFTLTVDQAPAITSAASTTFTVGALGTYSVVATGNPKPTFSLTGTVPAWLSIGSTTGILTGTPPNLGTGPYTFNFTVDASNGVSPDFMQSFTLTVDQAPAITSAASTTFTVGSLGTYSVVATGNPRPTFSLTGTVPCLAIGIGSTTGILDRHTPGTWEPDRTPSTSPSTPATASVRTSCSRSR